MSTTPDHPELHDIQNVSPEPSNGNVSEQQLQTALDIITTPRAGEGLDSQLPHGELPGFGNPYTEEDTQTACGDAFPVYCGGCGYVTSVGRTCNRAECPRCGATWARKQAAEITSRIGALRALLDYRKTESVYYHHVVISPPHNWYLAASDPLERTFEVIGDLFDVFDMPGVCFYHSYSGKIEDDRGAWKRRLWSGRHWDEVLEELVYRPHFHCIVATDKVPGGDAVEAIQDETGWVINRITPDNSNVSLFDDLDLARATTYAISHTTLIQRENSKSAQYRYLGTINNPSTGEREHWPKQVNVSPHQFAEHDANVRSVAPLTLGIAPARMTCEQVHGDDDHGHDHGDDDPAEFVADHPQVDVQGAAATIRARRGDDRLSSEPGTLDLPSVPGRTELPSSGADLGADSVALMQSRPTSLDGSSPTAATAAGSDADGADGHDDADADDTDPETRDEIACRGRLLPVTNAPDHLTDPTWRATSPHWEQLAAVYLDWRLDRDWQRHVDDADPDETDPPTGR